MSALFSDVPTLDFPQWCHHLSASLTEMIGPSVKDNVFWGVTGADIIVALAFLVLTAVVEMVLRLCARRKVRQTREAAPQGATAPPTQHHWIAESLESAIAPVSFLVYALGFYAAFTVLWQDLVWPETAKIITTALEWFRDISVVVAIVWFLSRWSKVVESLLIRMARHTASRWDDIFAVVIGKALRLILPCVGLIVAVPLLDIPVSTSEAFREILTLAVIAAVAYVLFQLLSALEEATLKTFRIDVADNLSARKIYTQIKVLRRVASVTIVIFTVAAMLMVFDPLRHLGTSLLTSAGVAGVVLGFGAQRSIAMLLAGFQLAITQPIRLDDVVIVDTEWGWIEEITLTYVVVRTWDWRRLIVPTSNFIEKSFQNWTRVNAELIGSVFFYVDYTVPLGELRAEFERVVLASPRWDKKVKVLQVTDCKDQTIELRALVSAADSSIAWDLRCEVREKLVVFLQKNYPNSLPRTRVEIPEMPARLRNGDIAKRQPLPAEHING